MGRLRSNPQATEIISKSQYLTTNFKNWNLYFKNENKLEIEIGMGKGNFIISKSINNPNINYVGIEKYSTVILKAINKLNNLDQKINNLAILNIDAKLLENYFDRCSVSKIYLNFSDPWPKARHTSKRLTSNSFLNIYKKILLSGGIVEFKTDNLLLFNFTIDTLNCRDDIYIIYQTMDLYSELSNKYNVDNVLTEYETKFKSLGKKINKVIFKYK